MGAVASGVKRTCQQIWALSTSRSVDNNNLDVAVSQQAFIDAENKDINEEIERLRLEQAERLKQEQEEQLQLEQQTKIVDERVKGNVSHELQELRKTILGLAGELQEKTREQLKLAEASEDHVRPYTRLDDYVHETMYALLIWLSTNPDYPVISMGQLMFFLKSPHIRQRKKYILAVERIMRTLGFSIFDSEIKATPKDLAASFDLLLKRRTQAAKKDKIFREVRKKFRQEFAAQHGLAVAN